MYSWRLNKDTRRSRTRIDECALNTNCREDGTGSPILVCTRSLVDVSALLQACNIIEAIYNLQISRSPKFGTFPYRSRLFRLDRGTSAARDLMPTGAIRVDVHWAAQKELIAPGRIPMNARASGFGVEASILNKLGGYG